MTEQAAASAPSEAARLAGIDLTMLDPIQLQEWACDAQRALRRTVVRPADGDQDLLQRALQAFHEAYAKRREESNFRAGRVAAGVSAVLELAFGEG